MYPSNRKVRCKGKYRKKRVEWVDTEIRTLQKKETR